MNTNKTLRPLKSEEEIKQKAKDQKRKTNDKEIVNFMIETYGGFSSEDMI